MILHNDICRCLGKDCQERDTCERYLQRESGRVMSMCLRIGMKCESKIEVRK